MISFEQTQKDVAELKEGFKLVKSFIYKKEETQNTTEDPKSIDKIEKLTGFSKSTLYLYCQKNKIPHHKKNGRLFFFKSEIIAWIKEGKQKTTTEVELDTDILFSNKKKTVK